MLCKAVYKILNPKCTQGQPILQQPLPVNDSDSAGVFVYVSLCLCSRLLLPLLGSTLCGLNLLHLKRSGLTAHWPSILTSMMLKNHPTTLSSPVLTCISATTAVQILVMNSDHCYHRLYFYFKGVVH